MLSKQAQTVERRQPGRQEPASGFLVASPMAQRSLRATYTIFSILSALPSCFKHLLKGLYMRQFASSVQGLHFPSPSHHLSSDDSF